MIPENKLKFKTKVSQQNSAETFGTAGNITSESKGLFVVETTSCYSAETCACDKVYEACEIIFYCNIDDYRLL